MDNRRRYTRVPLTTLASITPQGLQTAMEALVQDLSVGGIGVHVKGRYLQGEILVINISFVTDERETIKESLTGRVAWVKPLEKKNESAVGIELPNMAHEHPKLYAYLQRLDDNKVVPLRGKPDPA